MKKNGVTIIIIITLVIALAISVWQNINQSKQIDLARQYLLGNVFSSFTNIEREIDNLIAETENNNILDDEKRTSIQNIANYCIMANTLLMQYKYSFSSNMPLDGYPYGFDFISNTLGNGYGTVNDVGWNGRWNGIMLDSTISENELLYLVALGEDISTLRTDMAISGNPFNVNTKLTIAQLNTILSNFYRQWTFNNENSPYLLLTNQ